ncbi:hypothetical protein, partial [uncultured Bacteroides sp.]|uniref:hypothetical protein n=1 Tax=uncultured Bacteroides sp. TaxID=162156 RepID=UPI00261B0C82
FLQNTSFPCPKYVPSYNHIKDTLSLGNATNLSDIKMMFLNFFANAFHIVSIKVLFLQLRLSNGELRCRFCVSIQIQ